MNKSVSISKYLLYFYLGISLLYTPIWAAFSIVNKIENPTDLNYFIALSLDTLIFSIFAITSVILLFVVLMSALFEIGIIIYAILTILIILLFLLISKCSKLPKEITNLHNFIFISIPIFTIIFWLLGFSQILAISTILSFAHIIFSILFLSKIKTKKS